MHTRAALLVVLLGCHKTPEPTPPPAAPGRVTTPKARAADLYIKGYNTLVIATAHHLIDAHNTSVTVAEMGKLLPHFGVQHALMKGPLREAHEAFDQAKAADPGLAATVGIQADALIAASEALTESFRHLIDYYDRAEFQVDNGAQKETLAKDFEDKEEAYRTARGAIEKSIATCNDELALDELKEFEAEHSYGYWVRRADIDAKMLSRAAAKREAAGFKKAQGTLAATTSAMQSFSTEHPKGPKTFGKLVVALQAMDTAAIRFGAVLDRNLPAPRKKELADAEALGLEQSYTSVARLAARLYEMESSGGGLD